MLSWSEILNVVLGGGLVSAIVAISQLRSTVRKASAEAVRAEADAQKAEAEAESVRMDNAEHATRILMDSIVKPLKDELDETRRDMQSLKRAMLRLRKSIDAAKGCRYSDGCPVLDELQKQQELDDRTGRTDSAASSAAERQRAGPHNLPAGRC